ncbi:MAG: iron-containing alcohol dehydrogenase [Rhodospirillales bacterium]
MPATATATLAPIAPFTIARLPRIVFGEGALKGLPAEAAAFGRSALIVTGARSFRAGPQWTALLQGLRGAGFDVHDTAVDGEPSPEMVDDVVAAFAGRGIEVVVGIGGGSALDAAKAIAGLLPHRHSVMRHLEGVGPEEPYRGPSLPLILAPTTAGTGSEATKNAVLSRHGREAFKKSFRDEQLVARVAIVDPELLASCPPQVVAANGMDAFTQLLESAVSIKANPLPEALCWSGIEAFAHGFFAAHGGGAGGAARAGRSRMAYAALLSGSASPRPGSARCTAWHHRWERSSRSRTGCAAGRWWRTRPASTCAPCASACRQARRSPGTPAPARCWRAMAAAPTPMPPTGWSIC